jgi:hypothetical protein
MQDNLENKLTMYQTVVSLLDANSTKIASITALTDALTDALTNFKDVVSAIQEKDNEARTARTGNADVKAARRKAVEESALAIASALFALGSVTHEDRLKQLAAYNKSKLAGLRDTQLVTDVTNIKNLADANAAPLAAYGITPAMISALDTQLSSFSSSIGTRTSGSSIGVSALKQVKTRFDDADAILEEQMDKIMEVFHNSDTQFYDAYFNSRQIIDLGIRHDDDEDTPENPVNPEDPENPVDPNT